MRISQLAEHAGVPASTLRFYESSGLLPAGRSPNGYRTYDQSAVERLGFITAAKSLGLSLVEIADLLQAWQLGECSGVRVRLEPLVASRLAEVEQRIAELRAFSAHLATAVQRLRLPAPSGPCRADCGCAPAPNAVKGVPVQLISRDAALESPQPIACTLGPSELESRLGEWRALAGRAVATEPTAAGTTLRFPPDPDLAAELGRLAAAEQQCCAFFEFTVRFVPGAVVLEATAPADARRLLDDLLGGAA